MNTKITSLLFLTTLSITSLSEATSGRTNSSGCHNSKSVGYHCHGIQESRSSNTYNSNSTNVSVTQSNNIKPITRGLGIEFSENIEKDNFKLLEGSFYSFIPEKNYRNFTSYMVDVTKMSKNIYRIAGGFSTTDLLYCEKELNSIKNTIINEHGNPLKIINPNEKAYALEYQNINIDLTCSNDRLTLMYTNKKLNQEYQSEQNFY